MLKERRGGVRVWEWYSRYGVVGLVVLMEESMEETMLKTQMGSDHP